MSESVALAPAELDDSVEKDVKAKLRAILEEVRSLRANHAAARKSARKSSKAVKEACNSVSAALEDARAFSTSKE